MKKLFLWTLLLCGHYAAAQNNNTESYSSSILEDSRIQIMSPQVADMVRFDQTQIAKNTGRLDLQIPIMKWEDPDFDLPMSVSYNSEGFKPAMDDNFVGRNWSLNCFGIIYRDIKGLPDDQKQERWSASSVSGFLATAQSRLYDNQTADRLLWGTASKFVKTTLASPIVALQANDELEVSSDIYRFTFGKYSGKFMINFDGSVRVVCDSGGKLKVDLSGYHMHDQLKPYTSKICIITDDGYKYTFGGSFGAVEYIALSWTDCKSSSYDRTEAFYKRHKIVAFGLSSITAPNGRVLAINYMDKVPLEYHNSPGLLVGGNTPLLLNKNYHYEYTLDVQPYETTCFTRTYLMNYKTFDGNYHGWVQGKTYTLNKTMLVQSIATDDKQLDFHYSERKSHIARLDDSATEFGERCGVQLDSISLQNNDYRVLEKTRFVYEYLSDRMFLKSIKNSKSGAYSFNYNMLGSIPDYSTINIDHWGYWRGSPANTAFIPGFLPGPLKDKHKVQFTDDNREPKGSQFNMTLLKEVYYPTGGKLAIEYEPHTYSAQLVQELSNNFLPKIEELNDPAMGGGARVKQLKYYTDITTGAAPSKMTAFLYQDINASPDSSSGMLMYMPRYFHQVQTLYYTAPGVPEFVSQVLINDAGFNRRDYASDYIRYSTVTETNVLSEIITPDSTYGFSLSPQTPCDEPVELFVRVGSMDNYCPNGNEMEKKYATWSFYGCGYKSSNSHAYVTIRKYGSMSSPTLKEYHFEGDLSKEYIFNPVQELGPGFYTITFKKDINAFIVFRANYPHTGRHIYTTSGHKTTRYTDYRTNPDYYNSGSSFYTADGWLLPASFGIDYYINNIFLRNYFLEPEDRSIERGKVLSECYYDKDKKLVRREATSYGLSGFNRYCSYVATPNTVGNAPVELYSQPNKVRFYTYNPVEKRTVDYISARDSIIQIEKMTYDEDGYLMTQQRSVADGSWITDRFTYAFSRQTGVYELMNRNNYFPVVEKKRERIDQNGISTLQSWISYDYEWQGDSYTGFPVLKSATDKLGGDLLRIQYAAYDSYGNPLHIITDGKLNTVYLWSYLGKYPVARIENATLSEVSGALGMSADQLTNLPYPDPTLIDALRTKLPDAHIWTYRYAPLVGVVTATDPAGKEVYYDYDSAGRLVLNYAYSASGSMEILQANKYHYVNE